MQLFLKNKDKVVFLYERTYINPKDISIVLIDDEDQYVETFNLVV